jgi:hypothetical protein
MGFALSGFVISLFRGFLPCLLRENYHGFCPQWLYISSLKGVTLCLLRENFTIFPLVALYFHPSEDLYPVSSERTITDFSLSGFVFSSPSRFTPCLFRENFHGFYPQWFFFYFKSSIVLSSKGPFSFIFVMRECVDS